MREQLLDIFRTQLEKRNEIIEEMQISDETAKLIQEKILDQKNKNIVCQLYILLKKNTCRIQMLLLQMWVSTSI